MPQKYSRPTQLRKLSTTVGFDMMGPAAPSSRAASCLSRTAGGLPGTSAQAAARRGGRRRGGGLRLVVGAARGGFLVRGQLADVVLGDRGWGCQTGRDHAASVDKGLAAR